MRVHIKSSDVWERLKNKESILKENFFHSTPECDRRYQQARNYKSSYNIKEFISECGSTPANAVNYIRPCIDLVSECDSIELNSIFNDKVLPKLDDYTLNEIYTIENIDIVVKESINNQIIKNKICDRIYDNHEKIIKEFNIDNFIKNNEKLKLSTIIERCCSVIDSFDMPTYGKVNCSIEELSYVLGKNGISYDEKYLVESIKDYFLLGNRDLSKEQLDNVIKTNYCLREDVIDELPKEETTNSKIKKICNSFILNGDHKTTELSALSTSIFNTKAWDLQTNFVVYLELLRKILIIPQNHELSDFILNKLLETVQESICQYCTDDVNGRDIASDIKRQVEEEINQLRIFIKDYSLDTISDRIYSYIRKLEELQSTISDFLDMMYPKYNIESMQIANLSESEKINSLQEYKLFKFDNLVTRAMKIDKAIADKFKPIRVNLAKTVKKVLYIHANNEGTNNIYDIVDENGNIDMTICSYTLDESANFSKLHNYCNNICKSINEEYLVNSGNRCYYLMNFNEIEFHIRENESVILSPKDKLIIENHISEIDLNKMSNIYSAANLINENMDIINDSINYFKESNNLDMFDTFIEACSIAGISKDTVNKIYTGIKESSTNKIPIIMKDNLIESYEPLDSFEYPEYIVEGYIAIESILNELNLADVQNQFKTASLTNKAKQASASEYRERINNKLNRYGYNGSDERNNEDDEGEEEIERPTSNQNTSHEIKKPQRSRNDYEDIYKTGPLKNMTPTNIKLYIKGLAKFIKDKTNRGQQAARMADSAFNQFARSCRALLVSDRRESIIKGSVIPSFSKCVKIGIALVGLGLVTQNPIVPIITAIGGIAVSKHLTKKERILLMDDIDVELEVIDKEIAIADANNQLNKYRALLKMKKDLQRQRQRIYMNIRVGKDFVPSGTTVVGDL